jgi:hypothetical protein
MNGIENLVLVSVLPKKNKTFVPRYLKKKLINKNRESGFGFGFGSSSQTQTQFQFSFH